MVKLTMLARVADGLPLAEGLDSDRQQDLEQYKQQAKTLFKKLSQGPPPPSRMSYESGPYFLHYMVGNRGERVWWGRYFLRSMHSPSGFVSTLTSRERGELATWHTRSQFPLSSIKK